MTETDMDNNIRKKFFMWFIIAFGIIAAISLLVAVSALMINREPDGEPIDKESIADFVQNNDNVQNENAQNGNLHEGNANGYKADGEKNINNGGANAAVGGSKNDELYYLLYTRERVEIYTGDGVLYDYADVKTELLPEETFSELKQGMYIRGDEDLYDFLQAYSS